ncbi:hypothetical protein [Haloglomus litoreum]|uniref:hypothetical protein n=1 Tax=Haloglomus litoreum TaxID=3034026 RepID=UPI0023E7589B|nr:hypothetical protein [Haloglomus sp. DT116]
MPDRRRLLVVLVLALVFGLSLAGGYSYAVLSDEEEVEVTIDASGLEDDNEVAAAEQPTPTDSSTPTPTDSSTPTPTDSSTPESGSRDGASTGSS